MKASIVISNHTFNIDFSKPIDISLPLTSDSSNPIAWYQNQPVISPVTMGDWVGEVKSGSSTNFKNIFFNPHAHGTHTECLGHITKDFYSVNELLKEFISVAFLISVTPQDFNEDKIITKEMIETELKPYFDLLTSVQEKSIVIRTLPNLKTKMTKNYSNSNPPYLLEEAAEYLKELNFMHLLIDLPSVDREVDQGRLVSHKAFWNVKDVICVNDEARFNSTITELIFVDSNISDGVYILNLQIASFNNDASPSKPILYKTSF